jgi:hypothetical protein
MQSPKIFGIGLSRTGTTSLAVALAIKGHRSVHWPHDAITRRELLTYYAHAGELNLTIADNNDCITDTPIASVYRELSSMYSDSHFILTIRDENDWLDSCERFWSNVIEGVYALGTPAYARYVQAVNERVYGRRDFNREAFHAAYNSHIDGVLSWFKTDPSCLVVTNLCAGDGWSKICPFLGIPTPRHPFPHYNRHAKCEMRQ